MIAFVAACALVGAAWWRTRAPAHVPVDDAGARALVQLADQLEDLAPNQPGLAVAGTVRDASSGAVVADVKVVVSGPRGEVTATSARDGRFRMRVAAGDYRVFVRDNGYATVAPRQRSYVYGGPARRTAGAPDDALVPRLTVTDDVPELEVLAWPAVRITGSVLDREGHAIEGATVRARGMLRPVLGTDVAVSDRYGRYDVLVPANINHVLDATHDRYAGLAGEVTVAASTNATERNVVMTAGCVISGTVVDPHGLPASDGALERRLAAVDLDFAPAGDIAPDGSFRWVTTTNGDVTLRAWPWRSPPSEARTFTCVDGARHETVFVLGAAQPDLAGTIVDHAGRAVPFAYLDLAAMAPDGIGQQERSDAQGRWRFYRVPPGPYRLRAHAPGSGVVAMALTAPSTELVANLRGTGRIVGVATFIVDGSLELGEMTCQDFTGAKRPLEEPPRTIAIIGGVFTIDKLPVCKFEARVRWRREVVTLAADIRPDTDSRVELELGVPREKRVYGTIRDEAGDPIARALIGARAKGRRDELAHSDEQGRYSIQTAAGAIVHASSRDRSAEQQVGLANVDEEQLDLVVRVEP